MGLCMNLAKKFFIGCCALSSAFLINASAAEKYPAIVGKNGWLFYENEFNPLIEERGVNNSIKIIEEFKDKLQTKGISLVLTLVPVKARIYSEHLPDSVKWGKAQDDRYKNWSQQIKNSGIHFVDLNTAFLNTPVRSSETPLFYRLDSHWSPVGVEIAAQTISSNLAAIPEIDQIIKNIPTYSIKRNQAEKPRALRARDLIPLLSPEEAKKDFPLERFKPVTYEKPKISDEKLLGDVSAPSIALVGSSNSMNWTGFADDLRFYLQRDLVNVSVPADQGQWYGMINYLKSEAFQTSPPKILIWEIPERDLYATPNFEFRDARYRLKDADWINMASAAITSAAQPK